MEIILIKQTDERLSDDDAAAVRRFLFEHLSGATPKDTAAWNRYVRAMNEAGSGEYFSIKIQRVRSGPFHRLCMSIMTAVFKAQERFEDFRIFRQFVKIGAGFVDYIPDVDGSLKAVPKSVSFDDCTEEEIRQFLPDAIAFFRTHGAQNTLWPNTSPQLAEIGMESILNRYERQP